MQNYNPNSAKNLSKYCPEPQARSLTLKKYLYLFLGTVFCILGLIGAFLPVLPTTPFMLLAAFFYSRSSPKIYNWLISLPKVGPAVLDWNEKGQISIKAKSLACFFLTLALYFFCSNQERSFSLKIGFSFIIISVMIFILSRPHKE